MDPLVINSAIVVAIGVVGEVVRRVVGRARAAAEFAEQRVRQLEGELLVARRRMEAVAGYAAGLANWRIEVLDRWPAGAPMPLAPGALMLPEDAVEEHRAEIERRLEENPPMVVVGFGADPLGIPSAVRWLRAHWSPRWSLTFWVGVASGGAWMVAVGVEHSMLSAMVAGGVALLASTAFAAGAGQALI